MNKFFQTFQNIFKIEELRQRIIYTCLILIVVRLGAHVSLPGIDVIALQASHGSGDANTLFGLFDLFVGGAFSNAAIFSLGIMPYISASIILQLAGAVIPEVQRLMREGEEGRRKITQYTRIGTVFIAALQAWGISITLAAPKGGMPIVPDPGFAFTFTSVLLLTAGCVFMMWLGEQITERGIGNGISLIIFIGIIARLPNAIFQEYQLWMSGGKSPVLDMAIFALLLGIIASVVVSYSRGKKDSGAICKKSCRKKSLWRNNTIYPITR